MKRVFYIARNEIRSLFYSPIAWILMILFLILTGSDYFKIMNFYVGVYERGGEGLRVINDLTENILTSRDYSGYLFEVMKNLYIFFPLITMGLISKEVSSGTLKLLYSSPVRISEMVLGKFLAMIAFTLSLILILLLTFIALSNSLTHPDYGHLFASMIGIFLLLCTYAAIGLFISSLTSYQIVAALITFAVFAFLKQVGQLWQDMEMIRGITFYINISGKSTNLLRGLFNSRDIFYFLILIAAFLSFTIIKVRSATQSISPFKKTLRYLSVIAVAFLVGFVTNKSQLNAYWDMTRDKIHTITPPTQAMLGKLNEAPLEITVFGNLLDWRFYLFAPKAQVMNANYLFEPYIRFKPDIKVKFANYYDAMPGSDVYMTNNGKTLKEIAENYSKTYSLDLKTFLDSSEANKLVDTKQEECRNFFLLKYKNKTTVLRTFYDMMFWPGEDEIAAALNRLITTPPRVEFLCDEIERGPYSFRPRDYKTLFNSVGGRYALMNQGYDFDTLSLKKLGQGNISTGLAGLVIADPRVPFSEGNLKKIINYINEGGNLFITAETDRKDILRPLFDTLGIRFREGLLIQPNAKFSSDFVFPYMSDTAKKITPQFTKFLKDEFKYYGDKLFRVAMLGAGVLEFKQKNGFQIYPFLSTDSTLSWNRIAPVNSDSLQLKVSGLPSDERGSFVTSVLLTRNIRGKEQRIIISSDADYLSNSGMFGGENPRTYNYWFGFWNFSTFSYGQFPADTMRPQTDNSFDIKVASLGKQKIILFYIIPIIIALLGSIILIRRKRK